MTHRISTMRAAAILAVCGALALAGCGGGRSSSSLLPGPAQAGTPTQSTTHTTTATMSIEGLPTKTTSTATRTALNPTSSKRSPQYIDTTTANSAIVVSVTPQDPAEASQYGNLTVCYNLYTNGTIAPNNPPSFVVAAGPPQTVTVAFPAPPGTDGFQITQYAGQCGSTPYTLPVPPAGTPNNGILSQTPVAYASLVAGTSNAINAEIANCTQPTTPPASGSGFACAVPAVPGTGLLVASVAVANIAFGTLPIASPVREQGAFLVAGTKRIGIPIPLEGLNAAGTVVPGLTTPTNPNGGSGPIPNGGYVTVTSNDTTGHTKLYLVDAANGAVAQTATSNATGLKITEFNALAAADTSGGAVAGDPWVIVMTFDGTGASATTPLTSVVVTATPTGFASSSAVPVTTTITPQSAVYTAVAAGTAGYVDTAAPATPVGLLQSASGTVYVTDGPFLKIDGTATKSSATTTSTPAATVTSLTGLTSATLGTNTFVYAVDNGQVGGQSATEVASGLYAFNPTTLAITPVAAQAGTNNWVQFSHPVAVVQGLGYVNSTTTKMFLFVEDSTGAIYKIDIQNTGTTDGNGFQDASNVAPPYLPAGTLNPGTSTYVGTAMTSTGTMLFGDPGNSRIAILNASTLTPSISAAATGQPFTGFTMSSTTAGALYATTTTGQVYYVPSSGATPISLGLPVGTTGTDGPIGQLPSLAPSTTPTLTATNYPLQFQAGSFFTASATPASAGYSAPYTVAPFAAAGPVFTTQPAGIGLAADTSAGATTGAGKIDATAGILVFPGSATASAVVTPGSILFTDGGTKLRTLVQ